MNRRSRHISAVPAGRRARRRGSRGRLFTSVGVLGVAVVLLSLIVSTAVAGLNRLFGDASSTTSVPMLTLQRTYVVSAGDTLTGISARFGISKQDLVSANHLHNPNLIVLGQKLVIPSPYHPALTRQIIRSTSRRLDLDPAFALGVADEESGFNENALSPTGAIGVMQIEPATGTQLAQDLGRPIDLGVEQDNILCGAYYLKTLVTYYKGNERSAAAAYYEGQANLAKHGYLAGTRQYVDDVMALRGRYLHGS